jgi:hypothetical protein
VTSVIDIQNTNLVLFPNLVNENSDDTMVIEPLPTALFQLNPIDQAEIDKWTAAEEKLRELDATMWEIKATKDHCIQITEAEDRARQRLGKMDTMLDLVMNLVSKLPPAYESQVSKWRLYSKGSCYRSNILVRDCVQWCNNDAEICHRCTSGLQKRLEKSFLRLPHLTQVSFMQSTCI